MARVRAPQGIRVRVARMVIVALSILGVARPQHIVSRAVDANLDSALATRYIRDGKWRSNDQNNYVSRAK